MSHGSMAGQECNPSDSNIISELTTAGARAHNLLSEALHENTHSLGSAVRRAVRCGIVGPRLAKRLARLAQSVDLVRHMDREVLNDRGHCAVDGKILVDASSWRLTAELRHTLGARRTELFQRQAGQSSTAQPIAHVAPLAEGGPSATTVILAPRAAVLLVALSSAPRCPLGSELASGSTSAAAQGEALFEARSQVCSTLV